MQELNTRINRMGETPEFVVFIVCGSRYEISRQILLRTDNCRMRSIIESVNSRANHEIRLSRPKQAFESILEYFQTGKLHLPHSTCMESCLAELEYWGIDPQCLEICCYQKYAVYTRDQRNIKGFIEKLQGKANTSKATKSGCRDYIWHVMEGKGDTPMSKAFLMISTAIIVLSIFNVALSTLPRHPLHTVDRNSSQNMETKILPTSEENLTEIDNEEIRIRRSLPIIYAAAYNGTDQNNITDEDQGFRIFPDKAREKVLTNEDADDNAQIFLYIEHATNVFFTIELLIRLICCPSFANYFHNAINVLDMLILFSSIGRYIVFIADIYGSTANADFILYLQMLRVLRLLRTMEHVTAFKILCYSIRLGIRDLLIMLLFLVIGMLLFSNFLYYVESNKDIPSIPDAWWFSIITMTTVGFGDLTPKTVLGKAIGSLCALTGVMMFSLIIPVFVNTFQQLYQYTALQKIQPLPKAKNPKYHRMKNNSNFRETSVH